MKLEKLPNKKITIDGREYNITISRKVIMPPDAPRLVIVSYQPNPSARELLRVCIDSIQKYTGEPHELWVVDNRSPKENTEWLLDYTGLNVILNHNKYVKDGSYDNGVALEIAKNVIDPESQYLMTLHMDTMVCKEGWLSYLLSKFSKEVRAVGVRMDKGRTHEGILHILGAIFDFQEIKNLNLSFMPELPQYDVGDLITIGFRNAGYRVFACKNTFVKPDMIKDMPQESPFRGLNVDRAIDDGDNVFFLHLGRGIIKSTEKYTGDKKTTPQQWINFADNVVLTDSFIPYRLPHDELSPLFRQSNYTLRRYYVDEFYERNICALPKSSKILDIGGKKENKRGQFDIEKYSMNVKYANIDSSTNPDYLCDGAKIPVEDNSFDAVICSEVLEHVEEPMLILKEAYRVLKLGGSLYVCVPFLFRIHPDPNDYGRYTDQYWQLILRETGFMNISIEKQGTYPSVFLDMFRGGIIELQKEKIKNRILRWFLNNLMILGKKKVFQFEHKNYIKNNAYFNSYTTGYGIIAIKSK